MERKLGLIVSWLLKSGITITLNGQLIKSNKSINILGVLFDSKLQWSDHIALVIKKSFNSLNAIKLIKKFFNQKELFQLITSNFYTVLFYNSEIRH